MESPLITIIVPVFNDAPYLDRCIDSILTQTYDNLEVILVDDGSTDGSADMCDLWAQRDHRIRVIKQSNLGPSQARNAAFEIMHGEYVTMVDGDDFIMPHTVATLLSHITTSGADIISAGWCLFRDGTTPSPRHSDKTRCFTSAEAITDVFYQRTLTNSICSKLYKSSSWLNLRLPAGMLYEDLAVTYDLLSSATKIVHIYEELYMYRQRLGGSITSTFSRKRTHVLDVMEQLEERIEAEAPQHLKAVRSRLLSACFNIFLLCPHDGTMDDVEERCWRGIKRLRNQCLADPNVRAKNKAGILLSYLGQSVLRLFAH